MTEDKKQNSSAGADDSQDDFQEDEVDESEENQNQDGSLSSEEQKELEELRQKSELKKNIELLDEEYARKAKRNTKIINQDQEDDNQEEQTEMDKFLLNEREGAIEDFMSNHKEYGNPDKRDELLAEVKSFRDIEKAGYRSYTQLLNKAHRILGGDSSLKTNRDNIKKINESIASSNNASGIRSKFSDNEIQLTKEQKNIIKKIPGMTEKRYIERLKQDRINK